MNQTGTTNSNFGSDLDAIGDINLDGIPDWIIGSRNAYTQVGTGAFVQGQASVFSGMTLVLAQTIDLGGGCSAGAPPVLMLDAPPILASTRQIATSGFPPNSGGLLYVHFAPAIQFPIAPGCVLALDPAAFNSWIPIPLVHDASGATSFNVTLPSTPFLAGSSATLQATTAQAGAPLGIAMSNGLQLDFGY